MLDDIIKERRKKLEAIRGAGIDPYPARVERSFAIAHALTEFDALAEKAEPVSLVGRLRSVRDQGKIIFANIEDESGQIQIVIKEDALGGKAGDGAGVSEAASFDFWQSVIDLGDFVAVTGPLFKTKKGEKSVDVTRFSIISKSLLPLPDKWEGLEDVETRLRERYVDLIAHPEVREMFRKKSVFWQSTREVLLREGFLEVETPILEPVPGGAEAEPFKTHHNALDTDFYLRIAPELNLKRLLVGGFEKVFEIGRIFRNEGIDAEHLQDYTQMEMYWAYQDYRGLMAFVEKLMKHVIYATFGTHEIARRGQTVDWGKPWVTYDYYELFKQHTGLDLGTAKKDDLLAKAKELKIEHASGGEGGAGGSDLGRGRLIDLIYKKTVRPTLIEPGFLINPPVDIEPLAKRSPEDAARVERFQVVAYGTELGKGFSELNDPLDQRSRFDEQMKLREAGDAEAQMLDEDFVRALEYGMPPAAGFAYSERLFAVLADKPIRETVFFPLMRKK
jgi:lysyl-tRNA synthetase class 2